MLLARCPNDDDYNEDEGGGDGRRIRRTTPKNPRDGSRWQGPRRLSRHLPRSSEADGTGSRCLNFTLRAFLPPPMLFLLSLTTVPLFFPHPLGVRAAPQRDCSGGTSRTPSVASRPELLPEERLARAESLDFIRYYCSRFIRKKTAKSREFERGSSLRVKFTMNSSSGLAGCREIRRQSVLGPASTRQ